MEEHQQQQGYLTQDDVLANERAQELEAELEQYRPSPWTKKMWKLYAILFVGYLNNCLNGYDGSLMGSINALSQYQSYFKLGVASSSTGIVFSIYNVGTIPAVFIAGPLNDYYGRRWGIFAGCIGVIVGTCIQAPATSMGMFIGGRFVLGFGVALTAIAAP